ELSPDGRRVALVGGSGSSVDLWVADLERGAQTRLTAGELVFNPVWTPDGARAPYVVRSRGARKDRRWQIAMRLADGSRNPEILLDSDCFLSPSSFTPARKKLLYAAGKGGGGATDIYVLPLAPPRTPELVLGDSYIKASAVVSPDGRFMAYISTEGAESNVFVRPFPAGEGRWQISTGSGVEPRWSHDQKELFYRTGTGAGLYRVPIDTRHGFSAGKPELLFDRVSNAGSIHTYAPAPDGRSIFTPRSSAGRGSLRMLNLDLGFA